MAEPSFIDPVTAALSQTYEDSLAAAHRARRHLLRNTTDYVARLVRKSLPDAAVLVIDVEERELHEVVDAEDNTLWYAPASVASNLHDAIVENVDAILREVLDFDGLTEAGWRVLADGRPFRSVLLPEAKTENRRTARGAAAAAGGMAVVSAEFTPGQPAFSLDGPNSTYSRETRDRVRAAVVNSGIAWPAGHLAVVAHWTVVRDGSSADLTLACTALAAAGHLDPRALDSVALIGELGLDGRVRPVGDLAQAVAAARAALCTKVVVAEADVPGASQQSGISVYGVRDLRQALDTLTRLMPEA